MSELTPEHLANLRRHTEHQELLCLVCGHNGLHGVVDSHRPWWATGWGFLVFLVVAAMVLVHLSPLTTTVVAVAYAYRCSNATVHTLECTNCGQHITRGN